MQITRETKVHDLIEAHPFLLEFLASIRPEYAKLRNPVLRSTVARMASLSTVAKMGDMDVDELIAAIMDEIARHEIHPSGEDAPPAQTAAADAPVAEDRADEATRARRQEALKGIIRDLHDGASVDEVKARFDVLTTEIDATEIAEMEQALIAEGVPVTDVQRLCDVHVSVFRDSLERSLADAGEIELPAGHPVETYRRENAVLGDIVSAARCALDTLTDSDPTVRTESLEQLRRELARLALVDVHYLRKENQLFPLLEAHGIEGPTKVMWAIDDDIRARIKAAKAADEDGDFEALLAGMTDTLGMVEDMVYKEEKILFPTALSVLSDAEWEAMAASEAEIGFAWIEPPAAAAHAAPSTTPSTATSPAESAQTASTDTTRSASALPLPTGALTLEQIDLMVRKLPIDVTFVDEHDRVRFYSEGDRVFPRSPAVIGREVRNCHPPDSVDKVERILSEFKAGTEDVAEFWIELGDRFVHIRYFALRDGEGTYRGCLEVVHDATHVRALEGERRLLDW